MPTREDFETALRYALETFATIDPAGQARLAGARFETGQEGRALIRLDYLTRTYEIIHPEGVVRYEGDEATEPALWEQIITLHYLNQACGKPLAGKLIAFDSVPSGPFYKAAFEKRTAGILLKVFGDKPEALRACAEKIDARFNDLGDVAFTVDAFPRVPVTVIFWEGDDEFPARASFLFDASIPAFLPTEDITLTCQMLAIRLVKAFYSK